MIGVIVPSVKLVHDKMVEHCPQSCSERNEAKARTYEVLASHVDSKLIEPDCGRDQGYFSEDEAEVPRREAQNYDSSFDGLDSSDFVFWRRLLFNLYFELVQH